MTDDERQFTEILLHEYDTLRTEMIEKSSALTQGLSVAAAVFIGLIAAFISTDAPWYFYIIALLPIAIVSGLHVSLLIGR